MVFKDRDFCSQLFVWIKRHQLPLRGKRCLLAASGGLDSMVLLDFFRRFAAHKYAAEIVAAHLDHGLRPESAQQARELAGWCQLQGIAFVSERLQGLTAADKGLEAQARSLRYTWLQQAAESENCELILTAHSASDQLETLLMHWLRGGVAGLGGMQVRRHLGKLLLLRPLLVVTRSQLEAYAEHHQLPVWEDSSNTDPHFFRNRLRQQVIPLLLQENPQLEQQVREQSLIFQDEQALLRQQAQALLQAHVSCVESAEQRLFSLPVKPFLALAPALQRCLLREMLTAGLGVWKVFTHTHIEDLRQLAAGSGGKQLDLPAGLKAQKDKGQLILAFTLS